MTFITVDSPDPARPKAVNGRGDASSGRQIPSQRPSEI
jgi:hypothetical protein